MKFLAGLVIDIILFVKFIIVMVILTPIVWIATIAGCYLWEFLKWLFWGISFCLEWPFRKLLHRNNKSLQESHAALGDSQNQFESEQVKALLLSVPIHTIRDSISETSTRKDINIFVSTTFLFSDLWGFKIIFAESVLAAIALGFFLHNVFALHIAICIAGGILGGFLLLFLFHVKVGVWLVSIACSLFWGWFAADTAYNASQYDIKTTLIWGIGILLLTAAFHIKDATEL